MNIKIIETDDQLDQIQNLFLGKERIAYDVETTGLRHDSTPVGFSLVSDTDGIYFALNHKNYSNVTNKKAWDYFAKVVETTPKIYMHNAKFDYVFAYQNGVNIPLFSIRDTMIAAWLCNEQGGVGLKKLAKKYNFNAPSFNDITHGIPIELLPPIAVGAYCIQDSCNTLKLADIYEPRLQKLGLMYSYENVECPFSAVISQMEMVGNLFDLDHAESFNIEYSTKLKIREDRIFSFVGENFKITSSFELATRLFDTNIVPRKLASPTKEKRDADKKAEVITKPEDLKTSEISTDAHSLQYIKRRVEDKTRSFIEDILEYKRLQAGLVKFIRPFIKTAQEEKDHRIHPDFNQIYATATGRLSSSNPNFQNLPRLIKGTKANTNLRACIVAREGYSIITCDLSQIELRLIAHFSNDPNMTSIYITGKDINGNPMEDIHEKTRQEIEKVTARTAERLVAKNTNFGFGYLMSWRKFAFMHDVPPSDAKASEAAYHSAYKAVKPWGLSVLEEAKRKNYVQTITGRYRYFTKFDDLYSAPCNTVVQGSGADYIKIAMINCANMFMSLGKLNTDIYITASVHDEIFFECKDEYVKDALEIIQYCMNNAIKLKVPVLCDYGVGKNWAEAAH